MSSLEAAKDRLEKYVETCANQAIRLDLPMLKRLEDDVIQAVRTQDSYGTPF